MSLPAATSDRRRLHRREIILEGFEREDGLWDIEGHLTDTKDYDFSRDADTLHAGEPLHDMWLRITVDEGLRIVAAVANTPAVPYKGTCETIAPAYRQLVGLTIKAGFRKAVLEKLGGVAGCTHLTELIFPMATVAFQTLSKHRRLQPDTGKKPFQLDGCHALDSRGSVVARYYPKWHRPDRD